MKSGGKNPERQSMRESAKEAVLNKVLHGAAEKIVHTAAESLMEPECGPVLELLPGPRGLLPDSFRKIQTVGAGGCRRDMLQNDSLHHRVLLDPGRAEALPFQSDTFASVALFFGVETLADWAGTVEEVCRVLKPGGTFLVVYSTVAASDAAVPGWNLKDDGEKLAVVNAGFEFVEEFGPPEAFGTRKRLGSKTRPGNHPSTNPAPVWIIHAQKKETAESDRIPWGMLSTAPQEEADPHSCPYCGQRLLKWEVPHSPFEIECWYETDYLYICFNDACPYFTRGWEWMWSTLKRNVSYRHMYNPVTHRTGPMPVPTAAALRDGIRE